MSRVLFNGLFLLVFLCLWLCMYYSSSTCLVGIPGVDYNETNAPDSKISSFRIFVSSLLDSQRSCFGLILTLLFAMLISMARTFYLYPSPLVEISYPLLRLDAVWNWTKLFMAYLKLIYCGVVILIAFLRVLDILLYPLNLVPIE